jgi:hypothetical protein
MVESGGREAGDTTRSACAGQLAPVVGKIRSFAGSVSVVRADGTAVRIEVGSALLQGDRIETGGDGRIGISFDDGTEFNLANDARITIGEFDRDGERAPDGAQIQVAQGRFAFAAGKARGFTIDTPLATLRPSPQACAVATLTLVGFTIAMLQKLQAAGTDLITLDELIKYKDHLEHGDLLIVPHGGKPVLLDDPEITIVVDANFVVTTLANSPADMARLLGISADGDNTYELGLADPFTTGSNPRADTHTFYPGAPGQQQASNGGSPLPPNEDDPNVPPPPEGGGGNNAPQPVLVLTLNEDLIVEHDHTLEVQSGGDIDDTGDPFPIDLSDLPGFDENEVIGQATDGGGEDDEPFVSTAGSSGPVLITLEPSSNGVDSGLDVTGGGSILLFKEFTDGQQVVVGREEGTNDIAFIIFVTPDGSELWVQEFLPIDHGADGNNHDGLLPIDNDALVLRGTLIGTALTKTFPIGEHIVFVDDGPSIDVAAGNDASVLLTTQDADTDGDPTDEDTDSSAANFSGVFSIASQSFGTDDAGVAPTLGYVLSLAVAEGSASGLFSDGAAINLYEIDGVIIGSTAATEDDVDGTNTIFTLSVDADGIVTQTQLAEVDHGPPGESEPPYDDQIAVLDNGLVTLTASATIEDGDTDTASDSASIDLGGNIQFADDGPSIDVVAGDDESVVLTTHDDGDPNTDSSTANFSGVFSKSQSFGADGAGTAAALAYALSLAVAEGTVSGLFSDGDAIRLYQGDDGVITGSTAATEDAVDGTNTIFTLSVDANGIVTQTQFAEVDHAGPGDDAPPYDGQLAVLGNNLVQLTASATISDEETDSDSDSAVIDLGGNIQFADDGPQAVNDDPQEVAEDEDAIGGNVIDPELADDPDDSGQDDPGADGATLTHVQLPGGDFVEITTGDDSVTSGVYVFAVAGIGIYSFQANGAWTFDPVLNQSDHPVDASFGYRLTDGDADTDEATQPISVIDGDNPTGGQLGLSVEEPDLDSTGDGDIGSTAGDPGETASGTLSFTAGSDDITDFTFGETEGIQVQGLLDSPSIIWTGEGSDTLIGQIDGVNVISLELSDQNDISAGTTGSVTVTATLLDDFPHALLGVDSILIGGIQVRALEADGDFGVGKVRVRVLDDVPVALNDTAEVQLQTTLATVNALFVLDKSGSMGSDGNPDSGISLAKAAILDFASQSNVLSVRILPFDNPADAPSLWFDVSTPAGFAALQAFLDPITGDGGTNYEDAIFDAQQSWTLPPNPADVTNVYFISDGDPQNRSNNGVNDGNAGGSGSSAGLTSQEKAAWEAFLGANEIDNAYAVAIGTGINDIDLQEVAFPNTPNETNNVIVLESAGDLSATLVETTQTSTTIPGNVINNSLDDDLFGADGPGFVTSLRWDSDGDGVLEGTDSIYTFNGTGISLNGGAFDAGTEVTFDTGFGGEMQFNFLTGNWEYTTPDNIGSQFVEHFAYSIVDSDNDESAPATLDITVLPPPPSYTLTGAPDVTEGSALIFALTLSNASATDTVFKLATADGSATGGADFETSGFRYSPDNGTTWFNATGAGLDEVTILAGSTSILIEVDTSNDAFDEPSNEDMQLVVQSVVSGSVSSFGNDDDETGLIDDNDATPTLSISNGTTSAALANAASPLIAPVSEGDFAYFQLKLSAVSGADIVVRLDTDNGDGGGSSPGGNQSDADGGSDHAIGAFEYSTDGGLTWLSEPDDRDVRIPVGMTSILVRIATIDDSTFEPLEAFRVDFSGSGAGIISGSAILATIQAADGGFGGIGEIQIADDDIAVNNDTVITNIGDGGGNETIAIPALALLFNDIGLPGETLSVTSVQDPSNLVSIALALGIVNAVDSTGGGSFEYTGTTSITGATDDATVTINRAQQGQAQLDGTNSAEILLGRNGASDLIIGGDGDDVIIGGTGADDLQFNDEQHGLDHVLDFEVGIDDFIIDISGFGGGFGTAGSDLNTGANVGLYAEGSDRTAAGSGVRFFYDKDAGDSTLWFDQTAGAGQNWVALAKLENGVDISAADIHLVT